MDIFTRKLVVRYTIVFVIATILVGVVNYFMRKYTSSGVGGGLGIVPIIVGSMDAGQHYFRQKSELPAPRYQWKMAAIFTVISVVLSLVVAGVFVPNGLFSPGFGATFLGFVLALSVVYLVAAWFFFGFGAKNQLKAESR